MNKNKVVATVGEREITQSDVELLLKSMDPQKAVHFNSPEGVNKIIEELVNQELFYLYAKENNMDEEEQFKSELDKIISTFLKQYAINKVIREANIKDSELEAFYNDHKSEFVNAESVKASHILVDDESKALEILEEIKGGLSFEAAAKQHSKCPSKAQGGNLGYFEEGKMVPEFEAAAFNMKQNEISSPIKTQFGYHLIMVADKKEKSEKAFSEVKNQIQQHLMAERQQTLYFDTINDLKSKYTVKILE